MKINRNVCNLSYPEYANVKNYTARIDLSISENPLISKRVQELLAGGAEVNKYALAQDNVLIEKLSKKLSVKKENLLVTSGCDGALHHIAETFISDGDNVLIPCPSFCRYEFHARVMGGKPVFLNFSDYPFEFDINKIIGTARKERVKLLFLANPNNPTGHYIEKKEIIQLVECLAKVIVVIDESLIDYLEPEDSCSDLVDVYDNLIVARSFSKLYGLAGMRIGYIISNKGITNSISKTVSPFEVSSLAIKSAIAALDDSIHIEKSKRLVSEGLDFLKANRKMLLSNSKSSVVLICGKEEDLYSFLLQNGVLTVDGKSFRGLEKVNCIRVCITPIKQLRGLVNVVNQT